MLTYIDEKDSTDKKRVHWISQMRGFNKMPSFARWQTRFEQEIDAYQACQAEKACNSDAPFEANGVEGTIEHDGCHAHFRQL